jgi:signal transduction histidine kinase
MKVRDTGIGIARENLGKLFIPFVQLDSGTTRKHEGSGLGLSLTKNIVELQNGTVSVESTEGAGSTFSVILPRKLT